ncbi:MAG: SDR family NAD(P)-dependent oxidoreductase [Terriglobales bacterium]
MKSASFQVEVSQADIEAFARLTGDWNPLHTDAAYAGRTVYGKPVLHGAFSAGLISRLAGMHLPGSDCLLHSMRLRFVEPILPPVQLLVSGQQISQSETVGTVEATVSDAVTGTRYVDAAYEFSRGRGVESEPDPARGQAASEASESATILVTGASGGLGRALLAALGKDALGVSRSAEPGMMMVSDFAQLRDRLKGRRLSAIVHCAWPKPDNQRLLDLPDAEAAVEHHLSTPVRHIVTLAQVLAEVGNRNAMLILVGSTAAQPGRHNYRMPLYSSAKSLVPELSRILAVELASVGMRVAAVVFDVIDGGMNRNLNAMSRVAHADRAPTGQLPSPLEAAGQIAWLLENRSYLVSGATITLSGGCLP